MLTTCSFQLSIGSFMHSLLLMGTCYATFAMLWMLDQIIYSVDIQRGKPHSNGLSLFHPTHIVTTLLNGMKKYAW